MNSKKKWYEEYNYDLMSQELERRIQEGPGYTLNRIIDILQCLIDFELEFKKNGKNNEKELADYIQRKMLWEIYRREHTIRQIIM